LSAKTRTQKTKQLQALI